MSDLLLAAAHDHRGVGAMNVIQLEHAEAIVTGAERAGRPVVLQVSENTVAYHGSAAPLAPRDAWPWPRAPPPPSCVHLDHATRVDLVHEAVGLGVPSVMFDASTLPHDANVTATAEVAAWCHERGVAVEAELGEVGGKDGVHAPGVRTDPAEAAAYVAATGVDALAVAVGSSHAMTERVARLDDELIAALAGAVPVPLVLHGSSGVPDDGLVGRGRPPASPRSTSPRTSTPSSPAPSVRLSPTRRSSTRASTSGPAAAAVADEVARLLTLLG